MFVLLFVFLGAAGARAAQDLNDISGMSLDRSSLWVGTPEGLVQYEYPSLKPLYIHRTGDGLPSNRITAVVVDADGDVWAGTPQGLGRYRKSSQTWEVFTSKNALPSDSVRTLTLDGKGRVWVGTDRGLAAFGQDAWKTYRKADGLPSDEVVGIYAASGGTLWVATSAGLCSFNGMSFTPVKWDRKLEVLRIMCIWEDREGRLWLGTSGGLVERRKKNRWVLIDKEFKGAEVRSLSYDKDDKLMAATSRGLFTRNEKKWESVNASFLPSSDLRVVLRDPSGALLLATSYGLGRWLDEVRSSYQFLGGLPTSLVNTVACGREGELWIGTESGLVVERGSSWEKIPDWNTLNALPDARKKALLKERSQVREGWLTGFELSSDGILSPGGYGNDEWQAYLAESGLIGSRVLTSFVDADGSVWFGTDNGVSIFKGRKWKSLLPDRDIAGHEISFIYRDQEDRAKTCWIGTDSGLTAISGAGDKHTDYTVNQGLSSNMMRSAAVFAGSIYIATENGVDRLDGGNKFEPVALPEYFKDSHPRALMAAEKSLWIGTDQGLIRYDGKDIIPIIERGGRLEEEITALFSEGGNIWVGTSRGISRYDGKEWKHTGPAEGLSGSYVRAFAADGRGTVWVATFDGIARYDGRSWANFFSPGEVGK
jgi:ligand-binding sensor domain-containing protein